MESSVDNDVLVKISGSLLDCQLCMDKYDSPRILQCQHNLCKVCLHELARKHCLKPGSNVVKKSSFPCPSCRRECKLGKAGEMMTNYKLLKRFPENRLLRLLREGKVNSTSLNTDEQIIGEKTTPCKRNVIIEKVMDADRQVNEEKNIFEKKRVKNRQNTSSSAMKDSAWKSDFVLTRCFMYVHFLRCILKFFYEYNKSMILSASNQNKELRHRANTYALVTGLVEVCNEIRSLPETKPVVPDVGAIADTILSLEETIAQFPFEVVLYNNMSAFEQTVLTKILMDKEENKTLFSKILYSLKAISANTVKMVLVWPLKIMMMYKRYFS
ncbi:hypothetical protein DPMN_036994 [Dreissena polymorpha]|uniref:RING-type domain-containing protein n=1 Tax=Dreissena polymorpha TaxID=45954 RepID=A0A9D4MA47_DREPO|nr:hypothetical protein DPMN_036994 [Dreissena polymorpha]